MCQALFQARELAVNKAERILVWGLGGVEGRLQLDNK